MPHLDLLNDRLKLRHLVLVVAIADAGSVLAAAERMHMAQPAVTRSLREVERILGVELFHRGPRGSTPTLFGEAFLEHARTVLSELRRAGERLAGLANGAIGRVTVGTLLAGSNLLPHAIVALKKDHPRITVVVQQGRFDIQVPQLMCGEIDLILGQLNPIHDYPGLRQFILYGEPVRLAVRRGHPALGTEGLTLAGLRCYPWVLPQEGSALRMDLEGAFRAAAVQLPDNVVECASSLTVRTLVRDTDMIAALPDMVAAADGDLELLPVALETVRWQIGVTFSESHPLTPATRLMLDALRAEAAGLKFY